MEDSGSLATGSYNITTDNLTFGLASASNVWIRVANLSDAGLSNSSISSISGISGLLSAEVVQSIDGTYYGLNISNTSSSASVAPGLYYNSSNISGYSTSSLGIGRYDDSVWHFHPSSVDSSRSSVTSGAISSFSYFFPIIFSAQASGGSSARETPVLDTTFNCSSGEIAVAAMSGSSPVSGLDIRLLRTTMVTQLVDEAKTDSQGRAVFKIGNDGEYFIRSSSTSKYNSAESGPFELELCLNPAVVEEPEEPLLEVDAPEVISPEDDGGAEQGEAGEVPLQPADDEPGVSDELPAPENESADVPAPGAFASTLPPASEPEQDFGGLLVLGVVLAVLLGIAYYFLTRGK
jgi:hypothetical protein